MGDIETDESTGWKQMLLQCVRLMTERSISNLNILHLIEINNGLMESYEYHFG